MLQTMGERIRDRRQALGMTLEDLAKKVNVQASTAGKWERGYIKDMRSDKIQKVAEALEVTPAYLMGWAENKSVNIDTVEENHGLIGHAHAPVTINGKDARALTKEEAEILRIYQELSIQGRMKLLTAALELGTAEGVVEK